MGCRVSEKQAPRRDKLTTDGLKLCAPTLATRLLYLSFHLSVRAHGERGLCGSPKLRGMGGMATVFNLCLVCPDGVPTDEWEIRVGSRLGIAHRSMTCSGAQVEEEDLEGGLTSRGKALSAIIPVGSLDRRIFLALDSLPGRRLGAALLFAGTMQEGSAICSCLFLSCVSTASQALISSRSSRESANVGLATV